ncbi:MAG: SEC-C domain-containing protein [Acidimicrobiia bacterium]
MPEPLASSHAIRHAAVGVLGTRALPLAELVSELVQRGLALGPDPENRVVGALDSDGGFIELDGGRWISTASVLDATAWTTMVSAALAAIDCLPEEPDLGLFGWWALDHPLQIAGEADGTLECVELEDGTDGLGGPAGWLAGCEDAWVRVDVTGTCLAVGALERAPEPTPVQVAAVQAVFERIADRELLAGAFSDAGPIELVRTGLDDLLWEVLVADRAAFKGDPIPPVDDLLAAAGLERSDQFVTRMGTDRRALIRWEHRRKLAAFHTLDTEQVDAAEILLAVSCASIVDSPDLFGPKEEEPRAALLLAACLADPSVASAFVGEHAAWGTEPALLAGFARRLLDHLDDDVAAVGPRWLLAHSLDQLGDPIGAQAELERAVASGLEHPLALRGLAALLADAGDAPAALDLLRRAQVDEDDPLVEEIVGYALHGPPPTARRNDLCPCGSGRKYKVCHLGRERHPLIDRGPWLYAKARRYLRDNRHRVLAAEIASTIHEHSGRSAGFLMDLLDSELVADVALCEAHVFDDFVVERDAVLPDDEALLAARWALVSRSLFETEWAHDDELALRDLRTGDRIVVTNTHASEATRPGWLMLGRPLPIEDTFRAYSGFIRVPDSVRDEMLDALDEPDPFDVAALIGRAFAPPQMSNTDGEPLVFHELTYRVPDPERAARVLAAELQDDGDGEFTLIRDTANQPDTVIMKMQLTGDALEVSVNSDRRATEARALVESLLPDTVLEDVDSRDVEEMLADSSAEPRDPQAVSLTDDPELAGMRDELIRVREARWVDESVPALGDRTPRQAAADPIGRHELERLLRSFDDAPLGAGGFNSDRLRKLLDLT